MLLAKLKLNISSMES